MKICLMNMETSYILWFEEIGSENVALVGGKNASLGEMIRALKKEGVKIIFKTDS